MVKPKVKIKKQKITLKAKKPKKIKAVLKAWVAASEKMEDCDAYGLNGAPTWAENALAEVVKIVIPGKRLPTTGEWDLELVGEFFGRLQALGKLYGGEIPLGPAVEAECDQLEKRMASLPQPPGLAARQKVLVQDLQVRMEAVNQTIPQLTAAVLGSSHDDALKYQNGLLRGMNLAPDELTTARTFQRHTRTFWVLGMGWRLFSRCRSVAEVHRKLCDAFGEDKIGNLKTFENRVANKIGMKFGRSGRPRKLK